MKSELSICPASVESHEINLRRKVEQSIECQGLHNYQHLIPQSRQQNDNETLISYLSYLSSMSPRSLSLKFPRNSTIFIYKNIVNYKNAVNYNCVSLYHSRCVCVFLCVYVCGPYCIYISNPG